MSRITTRAPILLLATALIAGACGTPADAARVPVEAVPSSPRGMAVVEPSPSPRSVPSSAPTTPATADPSPTRAATPEPTTTPVPTPEPTAAATREPAGKKARLERYELDLYEPGDFVAQYTFEWCVGASLQMMFNLADTKESRSRARQKALWEAARDRSFSPFGGANPRGWTAVLNERGLGPYELVSIPDYDEALRVAARAMRQTKRPVGLVMWRGRHAWVMSGFTSRGDPRHDRNFRVTGIRVLDPLYPHGSAVWGSSPRPNRLLSPKKLAEQFVLRDSSRVNLGVPPGHLLVLPVRG